MEIISARKTKAGMKIVARETAKEKAANAIPILENQLKYATVLEKPALLKKIEAWKAKL